MLEDRRRLRTIDALHGLTAVFSPFGRHTHTFKQRSERLASNTRTQHTLQLGLLPCDELPLQHTHTEHPKHNGVDRMKQLPMNMIGVRKRCTARKKKELNKNVKRKKNANIHVHIEVMLKLYAELNEYPFSVCMQVYWCVSNLFGSLYTETVAQKVATVRKSDALILEPVVLERNKTHTFCV